MLPLKPYCNSCFPNANFKLALNFNWKRSQHCVKLFRFLVKGGFSHTTLGLKLICLFIYNVHTCNILETRAALSAATLERRVSSLYMCNKGQRIIGEVADELCSHTEALVINKKRSNNLAIYLCLSLYLSLSVCLALSVSLSLYSIYIGLYNICVYIDIYIHTW